TDLRTGAAVETATLIAIDNRTGKGRPATQGDRESEVVTLIDGFDHPRVIIGDFQVADLALKHAWKELRSSRFAQLRGMLIHVQDEWEAGISGIEKRALRDIAGSLGANLHRTRLFLRPA